jgi:uncharacterized protein HemX
MALIQRKISKGKQARLIISLVLVVALTLGVAYFSFFRKKELPGSQSKGSSAAISERRKTSKESSIQALDELRQIELFSQLKQFGMWPLPLTPTGRSQPFIQSKEQKE